MTDDANPSGPSDPSDGESIVTSLPQYEWDSRESVQYEVALEALSQLVAACTAQIHQLRQEDGADVDIDALISTQKELIARRKALRRADHAQVEEIIRTTQEARDRILRKN